MQQRRSNNGVPETATIPTRGKVDNGQGSLVLTRWTQSLLEQQGWRAEVAGGSGRSLVIILVDEPIVTLA
jgi:hypothetical protein